MADAVTPLAAWILAAMVNLSPPEKLAALPAFPGWEETAEARTERYVSIANDMAAVVLDPKESPLYAGPKARGRTAALLTAVAFMESGFAPDVDKGPCYRGKDGKGVRCDSGRSACVMQVMVGAERTREGWTREELFADRQKCFRTALHLMHRSFRWGMSRAGARLDRRGPPELMLLDGYAGNTINGHKKGAARLLLGNKVAARPGMPDDSVSPAPSTSAAPIVAASN